MDGSVVLDTSVVIKWFRQGEVLASQALALRDAYLRGQIVVSVPSLLAYELANVLRCKNDLTTVQIEDAVQSLFDMGPRVGHFKVKVRRICLFPKTPGLPRQRANSCISPGGPSASHLARLKIKRLCLQIDMTLELCYYCICTGNRSEVTSFQ